MERILYFDICAVIIMVILFGSIFLHKMTKGKTNRTFIVLALCCLLSAVFDLLSELHGVWIPLTEKNIWFSIWGTYGYYIVHNLTALIYVIYMICLVDNWHRLEINFIRIALLVAPYAVILIMLALNPWTHAVFYYNEALEYVRGDFIWVPYICTGLYFVFSAFYIGTHRNLLSLGKRIALYSLLVLTAASVVIQYFFPQLLVEVFASVVAILFIIISLQRPEENTHVPTGLLNYQAYTYGVTRAFFNRKEIDVIYVKLINHAHILSVLGYAMQNQMMRLLADRLQQIGKARRLEFELYYLEQGAFAFILGAKDRLQTGGLADEIRSLLCEPIVLDEYTLTLAGQIGVARCPKDFEDKVSLFAFENTFCGTPFPAGEVTWAKDIMNSERYRQRAEIDGIISRALTNHSFDVYYQPIYSLEQKRFTSAEALVRLKDEKYGFVSPAVFIPVAEQNGTIHQIGEYVFEEVCRFIKSAEFPGLGLDYIEINLSVAQCLQTNLAQQLSDLIRKHQVDPEKINLEITETAAEISQEVMSQNLKALRNEGFHFALDDYGVGYSNIARVVSLPLRIVKLDKTFTDKYAEDDMQTVLTSTVGMLKGLKKEIVVEGIETAEQLEFFEQLDCEHIQGFYFSKPLPREDFVRFIRENLPANADV